MSANSANSAKGVLGNSTTKTPTTKQVHPAKRWCWTLCNYDDDDISAISAKFREVCTIALFGAEVCPSTETKHLQGYCEFIVKCRPKSHGLTERIHFEKCKGNRASNITYCSKEGKVLFSHGLPKPLKLLAESNMYEYQRYMCEWALQEPDDRKILWLYGGKNIGKTQALKVLCNPEGKYRASILPVSKKHALAQIQRCELTETFVFNLTADESQYQTNSMFSIIESLKDGLFSTAFGTDNNSMCVRNSSNVIVVANQPPDGSKTEIDRDRFEIWEVSSCKMEKKPTSIMDDFKYDKCILTEDELIEKYE